MGKLATAFGTEKLLTSAALRESGGSWRKENRFSSRRKAQGRPYVAPNKHTVAYDPDASHT